MIATSKDNICGMKTVAIRPIIVGTIVYDFSGSEVLEHPTKYTIETDLGHLLNSTIKYINHSCEPSCIIDKQKALVIANRHLLPGDDITFDYTSNETSIVNAFRCRCGSENCVNMVGNL